MPSEFIEIDLSKRFGPPLKRLADAVRDARADLQKIKSVADKAAAGADWTAFEATFGVPSGQGETVYNLLAGAFALIDNAAAAPLKDFADRIG